MTSTRWKVGELSARTGVSVRTLHHYEEIGLLVPSWRTDAGHRLYSEGDIVRLQQIVSLRHIGLSLSEIAECLDRKGVSPLDVIEMHLAALHEQVELQKKLVDRLEAVAGALRKAEKVSVNEFIQTIEVITMFEKYYTPEQLKQLEERKKTVGEERIREVQVEWQEIFAGYRKAMERGADPTDPEVQELARRSAGLIQEFTGGDAGIEDSLRNMYRSEAGAPAKFGLDADPNLWTYMGRASNALRKSQDE